MRSGDGDWRAELVWSGLAVRVFDLGRGIYGTLREECSGRFELFISLFGDRGRSDEATNS